MRARIVVIAVLLVSGLIAPSAASAIAFAVTEEPDPRLVSFEPATPGVLSMSLPLRGLSAGEIVRGLDLRPANGALYLLSADALGAARLRTVDPDTGAVSAPIALSADPADATSPYAGMNLGVGAATDFNPVSDRLRIVTSARANLRVDPVNGFVTTDDGIASIDLIAAAAYTNSFPGSTTTTLYDIDYAADQLTIQSPPNDGTLTRVGGSLGIIEQNQNASFDISPDGNGAYLAARVAGLNRLYGVNLTTGAATLIGPIGDGATQIRGLTVAENLIRRGSGDVVAVTETAGVARITVQRASPRLGARVDYATADGSAIAGVDYDARTGTVAFAPGEVTQTIEIPLRDDTTAEAAESFSVTLSNPAPDLGATATLVEPTTTTFTIADDDPPGSGGPGLGGSRSNVDRTKPALLASADEIKRRGLRRRGLRVRFSCSEACTVRARLLAGRRAIATNTKKLRAAGSSALRLRPSRRGFAAIGGRRRLKVALTAVDAAGNASRYAFRVRLVAGR
jgi:hypothetical protein